jgi:hypothetical protein
MTALDKRGARTGKVGIFITRLRHMTTDRHAHSALHKAGEPCAKKNAEKGAKVFDNAEVGVRIITAARPEWHGHLGRGRRSHRIE